MREYTRAGLYLDTKSSITDKIKAVQSIIDALLVAAADSTSKTGIEEYTLDDGQTKIRQTYKSTEDIWKGIKAFETLKNYYISQRDGREMRVVPEQNMY